MENLNITLPWTTAELEEIAKRATETGIKVTMTYHGDRKRMGRALVTLRLDTDKPNGESILSDFAKKLKAENPGVAPFRSHALPRRPHRIR